MEEEKATYLNILTVIIVSILVITLVISSLLYLNLSIGSDIRTATLIGTMQVDLRNKNASMPFPDTYSLVDSGFINSNIDVWGEYSNMDLYDFYDVLKTKYVYTKDVYNCRYWSYVWAKYWQYNKDKYNWKFELITTDNHVFAMVYNSTDYCIMDEDNLNCFSEKD